MKKRLMALVLCLTVMMTMFAPLANATEEELLLSTATPTPAAATVEPQAESVHESVAPTAAHTEQPSAQPAETAGQPVATAAPAATAVPAETAVPAATAVPAVKVARMEEVKPGTTAETSEENAPLYAWVDQVRQLDEIPYRQTKVTPTQKLTLKGGDVWYHVEYKRAGRHYDGYLSEDVLKVTEPVTLLSQEEGDSQPVVVEPIETENVTPEESQEPEATESVETHVPETTEPAPTESVESHEPETTEATEPQEPETAEPAETEAPEATEVPAAPIMPSVDDQPVAAEEGAEDDVLLQETEEVSGIGLYAASSYTIKVGETVTLQGESGVPNSHSWLSENTDVATVTNVNSSSSTVTGVKAGTAVIKHTYYKNVGAWFKSTEKFEVTVEDPIENAYVYYLKTPDSIPGSNEIGQWGDPVDRDAKVNTTGATWVNDKNITSNVTSYVVSMPGGDELVNGRWLMPKDKYGQHYTAIFNRYKKKLAEDLHIPVENLTEEDITEIYLTPYKISKNNGSTPDKHIDCVITIVTKSHLAFTARFWVKLPGETGEGRIVEAKTYSKDSKIAKTTKAPTGDTGVYPQQLTQNGVTYRFVGWYNEAGKLVADPESWPYTPNPAELSDDVVNFYAHYELLTTDVKIIKQAGGDYASLDSNREFSFTYTVNDGVEKTFTLKPGETHTISNVTVGAKVVVWEVDGTGYEINEYVTTIEGASQNGTTATVQSVGPSGNTVTFTNTRKTGTINVTKLVTGGLGDKTKDFNFTASWQLMGQQTKEFTLKHGGTETIPTIPALPVGTVVTITEDDYTGTNGGYTTSYQIGEGEVTSGREATITVAEGENNVTFINNKEAVPDMGVLLDSLPYVVILAVVVLGAALVIVRRRKHRDDD